MTDLKIRVFKSGEVEPEATTTIPSGILKVASERVPNQAAEPFERSDVTSTS